MKPKNGKQPKLASIPPSGTADRAYAEGMAAYHAGDLPGAEKRFEAVVRYSPQHAGALHLLGVIAYRNGEYETAIERLQRAVSINGENHVFYSNLCAALQMQKRLAEAEAAARKALAINPNFLDAHNNLGNVLKGQGRLGAAEAAYRRALEINPDYVEALSNLGIVLLDQGRLDESEKVYRRALEISPDYINAYCNLGNVLKRLGKLEESVAICRRALEIQPDNAEVYNNLGTSLQRLGRMEDAIEAFQSSLKVRPNYQMAHSNLLLCMNYIPRFGPAEIYEESVRWDERHGAPLTEGHQPHANSRDPERRLRIGYISPDFRTHSVSYFFEPLLSAFDRRAVEVFCYADVVRPDRTTGRLRSLADVWRSVVGMRNDEITEQIRRDGIDILVDLSGHTSQNRLMIFAMKPAPVQVTWLGYPNTTGLTAIDYRITDLVADPETDDRYYTEALVRLPEGFLCYGSPLDAPAVSRPSPAAVDGRVTFGSFNNLAKVTKSVVRTWARILAAVPDSRMLVKQVYMSEEGAGEELLALFEAEGIDPERVEIRSRIPSKQKHLALYGKVDVALDPFPYNGTTTTCEALWMGVPVVTLRGDRHSGRVGASLLERVGLSDLVADDPEGYVEIAANLGRDTARLNRLRENLRDRMRDSSLCDADGFARHMETAFREMWRRWCGADDGRTAAAAISVPTATDRDAVIPGPDRPVVERVRELPVWHHRIPLPDGVVTPGTAPRHPDAFGLPERLEGKRVLDVGALDGYWTFEVLSRGAAEVVAIDDFSFYRRAGDGQAPRPWATFDLCREALGYDPVRCRRVRMSIFEASELMLGRFDLVLVFDVLPYLRYPLMALDRLATLCDGEILVESAILDDFSPYRGGMGSGYPNAPPAMEFYPGNQYEGDPGRWWSPSLAGLSKLVTTAGFTDCRAWKLVDAPQGPEDCRGVVHGRKQG